LLHAYLRVSLARRAHRARKKWACAHVGGEHTALIPSIEVKESIQLMKRVVDLIEQAPACPVIRLDDGEKDIYNGAGLMLARFIEGTLVELHDPTSVEFQEDDEAMAEAAIKGAIDWIESTTGEHWLVLCSGYSCASPAS